MLLLKLSAKDATPRAKAQGCSHASLMRTCSDHLLFSSLRSPETNASP